MNQKNQNAMLLSFSRGSKRYLTFGSVSLHLWEKWGPSFQGIYGYLYYSIKMYLEIFKRWISFSASFEGYRPPRNTNKVSMDRSFYVDGHEPKKIRNSGSTGWENPVWNIETALLATVFDQFLWFSHIL